MKNYREYIIRTSPFLPELVSGLMWELDITGVNEENDFIKVFTNEDSEVHSPDFEKILRGLKQEGILESFELSESTIENKNWNEEWEKTINVIEVSEKIVIKPTFRDYTPKEGQLVLTIDPKMSFGTGEHQTTKLMLHMIDKYVSNNDKVLDVGTGTGVLAIAAVKLGAAKAIAFDNDEWCYENGLENCLLNNVQDTVEIRCCEISDISQGDFDLVLANINKHILMEIGTSLKEKLSRQGKLILSGLLFNDEEDIVKKYAEYGFKLVDKLQMDEWISLVLEL